MSHNESGIVNRLAAHVGCGDVDNMGGCPQCEAIRNSLRLLGDDATGRVEALFEVAKMVDAACANGIGGSPLLTDPESPLVKAARRALHGR